MAKKQSFSNGKQQESTYLSRANKYEVVLSPGHVIWDSMDGEITKESVAKQQGIRVNQIQELIIR